MRTILKQLLVLLFFCSLIYVIVAAVMLALQPPSTGHILDTGKAGNGFTSEPQKIVLDRDPLKTTKPKIIFIGASNTVRGFRPEQFVSYFPGYEIHNMAVSASNLSQTKRIIELAYEVMPKEAQGKSIFVLGLAYMLLMDNKVLWHSQLMDIENEELRFGLYQQKDGSIKPQVPQKYFSYYVKFLQPFFYLNNVTSSFGAKIKYYFEVISRVLLKSKNPAFTPTNDERPVVDEVYKKWALNKWHENMGTEDDTVSEDQFMVLLDIAKLVSEHGGKLIIVDLPLPAWHQESSKHFKDYQFKKKKILSMASSLGNVYYINMQDLNNNVDYIDSAHPSPKATYKWSRWLSQKMSGIVF